MEKIGCKVQQERISLCCVFCQKIAQYVSHILDIVSERKQKADSQVLENSLPLQSTWWPEFTLRINSKQK